MLHRDIKPENVLVDMTGQCKLADFGVAAVVEGVDSRDTAPGTLLGTVLHLAPEVLEGGRAAVTSDVYSLGSTLASLALGKAPFARTGDETVIPVMMRIVRDPLPDLRAAGLADRVAAAIEMAMAKEPEERFGSAAAFGNALQQIQKRIDLPVTPDAGRAADAPAASGGGRVRCRDGGRGRPGHRHRAGGGWGHGAGGAACRCRPAATAPRPADRRRGSPRSCSQQSWGSSSPGGTTTPPRRPRPSSRPRPPSRRSPRRCPATAASTHSQAIAAAEALGRGRGLDLQVVDTNSYLGPAGSA